MLRKPSLADEDILDCLKSEYGLVFPHVTFLPWGADLDSAVYRVNTADGKQYFLKLRSGPSADISAELPHWLHEQGIPHILPPLPSARGNFSSLLRTYRTILYPFIEGKNGYQAALKTEQWEEFGALLRQIHSVSLPKSMAGRLVRERFIPAAAGRLHHCLQERLDRIPSEPLISELTDFLRPRRSQVYGLIERVQNLARLLRERSMEFVLCHGDIHAGNLLIGEDGSFYLVDWDTAVLAPKERDLMSIGAGLFGKGYPPAQEEQMASRGYGPVQVDPQTLVYYRLLRILEDLDVECRQIFSEEGSPEDRQQALGFLRSNFEPNGTIELATRQPIPWV